MPKFKTLIKASIFSLASLLFLTACAGLFQNKPAQVDASIRSVQYLNPNIYHQASPVVVVFYQLKTATAFDQANFYSLYSDSIKALGADLLDKHEVEIRPDQTMPVRLTLVPNAAFIGVIAAYRDPDKAQWRQKLAIPANSKNIKLDINLATQSLVASVQK